MVTLVLIRAGVIAPLCSLTEVCRVYVLIFFLQAASAGFTPAFQAVIPAGLKDGEDYRNALKRRRASH